MLHRTTIGADSLVICAADAYNYEVFLYLVDQSGLDHFELEFFPFWKIHKEDEQYKDSAMR